MRKQFHEMANITSTVATTADTRLYSIQSPPVYLHSPIVTNTRMSGTYFDAHYIPQQDHISYNDVHASNIHYGIATYDGPATITRTENRYYIHSPYQHSNHSQGTTNYGTITTPTSTYFNLN
jgi:hypothetical protein